jgi:hypothetical protein
MRLPWRTPLWMARRKAGVAPRWRVWRAAGLAPPCLALRKARLASRRRVGLAAPFQYGGGYYCPLVRRTVWTPYGYRLRWVRRCW